MSDISQQIQHLRLAELQFRLASAVRLASTFKTQPRDLPIDWSHGKHRVRYDEIALSQEDADYAAWSLHRSATFLIAVAIKNAIRAAVADPKTDNDADVRYAYQIARLIRNAFAHAPFDPVWSIDADCRNRVFAVGDIIRLDTVNLHDQHFDWRHYGGPLALLRLSQFVRTEILKETEPLSPVIPMAQEMYIQQGDLILMKVDEIPADAVPVKIERLPDGGLPLGGGHVVYPGLKSKDNDS
ncbi:MAG: hypothetical protein QOH39_1606 [Verrucomicrobiota bacterium]|jgi:hypothetical protein